MTTRRSSLCAVLLAAAACTSDLPRSNPFDPNAPPSVQAKARLVGTVELESVDGNTDRSGVTVMVERLGLEATTSQDGSWVMADVPPGTHAVEAFKDGYERGTVSGVVVELSAGGSEVAVPALALRRARGSLTGLATLEGEEFFEGITAALSGSAGAAQTDAQGRFVIAGVPTGTYELALTKVAFLEVKVGQVVVSPGSTTEVAPVSLSPNPGSISGRVLVRGAADSSGVLVTADGMTLGGRRNVVQLTTTLDPTGESPDGAFTLSNVAAGLYNVSFSLENYSARSATVSVAPAVEAVLPAVELEPATGIATGTATLEGGLDHAGIVVSFKPEPSEALPAPEIAAVGLTDGAGAWRVEGLRVGRYDVLYSKRPGYADRSAAVTVVRDASVIAPDVVLPAIPGSVAGRVLLEGQGPEGDLSGTAVAVDNGPSLMTDADGRFSLEAPAGAHALQFRREGFRTGRVQIAVAPGDALTLDDVTLSLARGVVHGALLVEGRPFDASGVLVTLSSATDGSFTALTDRGGAFRFTEVPTGDWQLNATLTNYEPLPAAQVQVLADRIVEAPSALGPASARTLFLRRDATLSGSVLAASGAAVAGVSVELSGDDLNGDPVNANASTVEAGTFALESLPQGTYRLRLSLTDHEPLEIGPVALSAGQAVGLAAVMLQRSRGDAAGQFLLAGAQSHADVRVTLSGTGTIAGFTADALTDSTGRFTATGLPVGTYDVQATKAPDWSPTSGTLTVLRNRSSMLLNSPLSLQVIAAAGVSGKVTVDRGLAAGTPVRLRGEDLRGVAVDETRVAAVDGSFWFSNLVGGNYQLTCERANYDSWSSSLSSVASGAQVSVPDVVLRISRGEIGGTVRLEAGSVPGFDPGADWSGVRVALMDESGAEVASTTTDVTGAFSFTNVAVATVGGLEHGVRATREHFAPASVEVVVPAAAVASVGPIVLELQPGSMTGHAFLHDKVGGAGRNSDSTGVTLSVSGVAYNGVPFSKAGATSAADGSWSLTGLPPGTFEVRAASTSRRCEGGGSFPVRAGRATEAGEADCYDTRAPGALVLGAVPAWSNAPSLEIALAGAAADPTEPQSNLRGYEYVRGRLPDWNAPEGLVASGPFPFALAPNAENTLWVRAVDWLGNAGPPGYVTIRHDDAVPGAPTVLTPRPYLDTTTTTITLSGAESEANFDTYLFCKQELAPDSICPPEPPCQLLASAASFALPLSPGRRTCGWARIRDLAGNQGPVSAPVSVLCDTTRPTAPQISPVYEPSAFTARARSVDVFVTSYSLFDAPLATIGTQPGKGIAHLEVDLGAGFIPLCPECRAAGDGEVWDPCAAGCGCDPMVQCASVGRRDPDGTWSTSRELRSLRVPLVDGTTNRIAVRAVDLAGNLGDGASISVVAEGMRVFAQGAGTQSAPRFHKGSVAFADFGGVRYAALDKQRTPSAPGCLIPSGDTEYLRNRSCETQATPEVLAAPGEAGLSVIAGSGMGPGYDLLQLLPAGAACPTGVVTLKSLPPLTSTRIFTGVAASGSNLGWVETEDWNSPSMDEKEVFTCQLDDCLDTGKHYSLGPAAGAGHMASLRAGGDYLLWATEATASCPTPKYRWKLAYVSRAPDWAPEKSYEPGAIVSPPTPNGHAYRALNGGTSSASGPKWPTGSQETVTESTGLEWQEISFSFEAEHATLSADGKLLLTADNTGALAWAPSTTYSYLQVLRPSVPNGYAYLMWSSSGAQSNQGLSGAAEPAWPAAPNALVVDGELTWFSVADTGEEKGNPPAVYGIREIGADRLWSAADPVVENRAIGEMVEWGIAIEAGRAVAISKSFDKSITVWDAAPDGAFVSDPAHLRHLVAKGGDPRGVALDQGLLVYSYGSDLVATDLSTLRWESAVEWEQNPVLAEDGTILFRRGGPEDLLVARTPDGRETAGVFTGHELDRDNLHPMATGMDLLVPSPGKIEVFNPAADGLFFTEDDEPPAEFALPAGRELRHLATGGGNAALYVGDHLSSDAYALLKTGSSLRTGSLVPITPTAPLHPYLPPAVSEHFVAYVLEGGPASLEIQYVQAGAFTGTDRISCRYFATKAGEPTWCSDLEDAWNLEIRMLVASGQKLLLQLLAHDASKSWLVVLDPGPDGRFCSSSDWLLDLERDDTLVEVPLGDLAIEQGAIAFGGDAVTFAASAPGLSSQLYSWRPESAALLQRTFHFSEKRAVRMAPSGRIVWADTLFDSRSIFVWLP